MPPAQRWPFLPEPHHCALAAWRLFSSFVTFRSIMVAPFSSLFSYVTQSAQTTRAVKAGNYRARATVRVKDEVGELAAALWRLHRSIKASGVCGGRINNHEVVGQRL